jgi:predicted adenine nucleotide alpha hydrolase (AANH) superfamily ATPase
MKKVLVHICCAHCAAYTVAYWRSLEYKVAALWYNPNIHPFTEHRQRLESVESLMKKLEVPLDVMEGYEMIEFLRRVSGREATRCRYCFEMRLDKTARFASEKGFDGFTTTLLISPHQEHELVKEIGENNAIEHSVEFFYTDLRKRYSDSRHITKPMDLYRQQYCGCIYSEYERYTDTKIT